LAKSNLDAENARGQSQGKDTVQGRRLLNAEVIDPVQDAVEFYAAHPTMDGWDEQGATSAGDGDGETEHKNIRFDQVISETAPPYPDVKPAPGTLFFRLGLDRFDGKRAYLPLFAWTWGKYIEYERRLNDAANGIKISDQFGADGIQKGHAQQIAISGDALVYMVPDQLYYDGPEMNCEQNREADSETITSNEEMTESESSSLNAGYEMVADVNAGVGKEGVGKASASTTVRNAMMVGTSNEAKDYKKEASKGYTRSVFSTIKSRVWSGYLVDDSVMSMEFKEAVDKIKTVIKYEPDNKKKLVSMLGQLMFNFGTDYMVSAKMGGKIVKQTSAQSEEKSGVKTQDIKNANSVSMQLIFDKLDASSQASQKMETSQKSTKGMTSSTAKFYGGQPSHSYEDWCSSTRRSPYPMSFMTREVAYLMETYLDAKEVATRYREFIYTRAAARESCEKAGAGLQYNERSGECEMPPVGTTCPTGQVKHKAKADFHYNGKLMYHKGQMICEKCPAGKEAKIGAAACADCQPGYYAGTSGTGMCSKCPAGRTSRLGGKECKYFEGNFYINARTYSNAAKTQQKKCALSGAGDKDKDTGPRGDGDCFGDSVRGCVRWAAMDCRTAKVKLKLEHVESEDAHVYTIRDAKGSYLSYTVEGDWDRKAKWSAYWGDTKTKWFFYQWNDQYFITQYDSNKLPTTGPNLDTSQKWLVPDYSGEKSQFCDDKCPWVSSVDGTNTNKPSSFFSPVYHGDNELAQYCGSIDKYDAPSQCAFTITKA
jgi:hypothetical protein